MAKQALKKGTTSKRLAIFIQDSSQTTGEGLTGLLFSSSGLSWYYWREDEGNADGTAVTLVTATRGTFASGGFIEKDATNLPGFYEIGIPNAAIATGASWVVMQLKGATNMAELTLEVQLTDNTVKDVFDEVAHADYGLAQLVRSTTPANTLDVTATGAAGIDWANVEGQGTAVDLSATDIQLADTTTTLTNKTGFSLASTGLDAISQAATGMVEIAKAVWDRVLSGATHNIATSAGRRLRGIQEFQGYENGAVWIDTVDGTAGTTNFENGTVENPVNSIADANILAASLKIERFEIAPGSSITFGASQNNQTFSGHNWTLALGGRDIAGSGFFGATVSGIASGTGTLQIFDKCILNAMSHIKGTHLIECGIAGTQTIVEAGDYFADRCHSAIAGTATPTWDFGGALAASNLSFRNYSGGIEIQNMGAGAGSYTMSLEGRGQLIINANCSATSTVAIRGLFTITDNAGGAVTLSDDARFTLSGTADANWDEVLTIGTHDVAESTGRRLRNLQEFEGYEDGAIWIDTANGVGGTTDFENGTVGNPTNSIGDANTLATNLGLKRFRVAPGSSITFVAAQSNQVFIGDAWTLALGGQSLVGTTIIGATVSGVASGAGTTQAFEKCHLMATSHIKGTYLIESAIEGTLTIVEAGDFFIDRCYSAIAGTATPTWDFGGALNASNVSFRNYSGGIEIQNMGAGTGSYNMSLEGRGQLIINANCSATSTVAIRGLFTVTDNAGGAVTLSDAARFAEDQSITTVTGNVDGSVASIGAGGIGSGVIAAAELINIADGCLDRRLDLGTDSGGNTTTSRTWRQALRTARNRVAISGGTMTVYEEDDTTSDFTAAITTTAGDPITELNPA
jgi:hypothetical protein